MCTKLFIFIVSAILVTGTDVNCPPKNSYPYANSHSKPYLPMMPELPYDIVSLNAPIAPVKPFPPFQPIPPFQPLVDPIARIPPNAPVQPISPMLPPVRPISPVLPPCLPDPVPLPMPVPPVCGVNEVYIPQGIAPNCDTECSRLGQPCNRVCIRPPSGCYCITGHGRDANNVCVPLCQCPVSCSLISILY